MDRYSSQDWCLLRKTEATIQASDKSRLSGWRTWFISDRAIDSTENADVLTVMSTQCSKIEQQNVSSDNFVIQHFALLQFISFCHSVSSNTFKVHHAVKLNCEALLHFAHAQTVLTSYYSLVMMYLSSFKGKC